MDSSEECDTDGMKEETYEFAELLAKKVGEFGKKQILLSMLLASFAKCLCLQCLQSLSPVFKQVNFFLTLSLIDDTVDQSVVDCNFSREGNEWQKSSEFQKISNQLLYFELQTQTVSKILISTVHIFQVFQNKVSNIWQHIFKL